MRPLSLVCMVVAVLSGLYLYRTKYNTQMLEREINQTLRSADNTRARIGLLQADYALLNDPIRLQELADQHLALKSTPPGQFTTLADLQRRLPAIGAAPVPAEPAPEVTRELDVPVSAPRPAAPSIAAPTSPLPAPPPAVGSTATAVAKPAPPPAASAAAPPVQTAPATVQSAAIVPPRATPPVLRPPTPLTVPLAAMPANPGIANPGPNPGLTAAAAPIAPRIAPAQPIIAARPAPQPTPLPAPSGPVASLEAPPVVRSALGMARRPAPLPSHNVGGGAEN